MSELIAVPIWALICAAPFTVLGIGAAVAIGAFVWGCIKGMERGL